MIYPVKDKFMSLGHDFFMQQAADLATCYELGLRTTDDVVAWADRVIASEDHPPIDVIELSLCAKDGGDVLRHLERLAADADYDSAVRRALCEMRDRLDEDSIDLRIGMTALYHFICRKDRVVSQELEHFVSWADEDYDLIERGYSERPMDQFRSEVLSQLAQLGARS